MTLNKVSILKCEDCGKPTAALNGMNLGDPGCKRFIAMQEYEIEGSLIALYTLPETDPKKRLCPDCEGKHILPDGKLCPKCTPVIGTVYECTEDINE